jgi:hypothetical protein
MLKMTLLATAAIAGLSLTAWAGEGRGDPFPGPDAAVTSTVPSPNYTMGADAPYNYFSTGKPVPLTGYHQADGQMDNPYPFSMPGQVIRVQPAPPSTMAHSGAAPATHG